MSRRSISLKQIALVVILFAVAAATSGFTSCGSNGSVTLGPVIVYPNTLSWQCPTTSGTLAAFQSGFTGTFTAQVSDTTRVTVAPTTPPGTFLVQDGLNPNGTPVTVTITGGGGITGSATVTALGCACLRHHDMWSCPLKRHSK